MNSPISQNTQISQTWLVTGASGQLGSHLLHQLHASAQVTAWSGTRTGQLCGHSLVPVNFLDQDRIASALRETRPATIIHAAALSRVDECYRDPDRARRINVEATRALVELAAEHRSRFIYVSTDLVFDGRRGNYSEDDQPHPISAYGQSKLDAEAFVRGYDEGVVARVSLLYGPSKNEKPSYFDQQCDALRIGKPCTLFEDEWRTPLDLPTAAKALIAIAQSDATGLLHVGGTERLSRLEMGRRLAECLHCDDHTLVAAKRDRAGQPEPRPEDTSLNSTRFREMFPSFPFRGYSEAVASMILGQL